MNEKSRLAVLMGNVLNPFLVVGATFFSVSLAKGGIVDAALYSAVVLVGTACVAAYMALQTRRGRVSGFWIPVRRERYATAALVVCTSSAVILLLTFLGAPPEVLQSVGAFLVAAVLVSAVTLKWKISAHTAVSGYAAACALILLGWWSIPFVMVVPALLWARVAEGAHTGRQALAGALLGSTVAAVFLML